LSAIVGSSLVLTMGWLAIRGRISEDSFEVQGGSWTDDQIAMAYAPFVHEADRANAEKNDRIRSKRLLSLARKWDDAVKRGVLRPLKPTSFEDDCTQGVRGQILRSKSLIVSSLLEDAERLAKHRISDATDEVLLAVRLSESQKYGDLSLISVSGDEEALELKFLRTHTVAMPPRTRSQVKAQIADLVHHEGMLTVAEQASTGRFYDYQRRFRGAIHPAEIWQNAMIGRRILAEGKTPTTLRAVQRNYIKDQDSAALEYLLKLKLATRIEDECVSDARTLLAKA